MLNLPRRSSWRHQWRSPHVPVGSKEPLNIMAVIPNYGSVMVFPVCHVYECTRWTCWLTALASMVVMFSVWWTTCSSISATCSTRHCQICSMNTDEKEQCLIKDVSRARSLLLHRQILPLFYYHYSNHANLNCIWIQHILVNLYNWSLSQCIYRLPQCRWVISK